MGGDFDHRWTQTRESIPAMKELWTKPAAEFHGKYYDFPPVKSFPKPLQKPHPPVLLGGGAKNVLHRVVAWGDGWLRIASRPELRRAARPSIGWRDAGRDRRTSRSRCTDSPPTGICSGALARRRRHAAIVRPPCQTESEMGTEMTRIADAC